MDLASNELIIGSNIFVNEIGAGAVSNSYGFYSITLPKNKFVISVSSVGYKTEKIELEINKNISKNFYLEQKVENLNEVIVVNNIETI